MNVFTLDNSFCWGVNSKTSVLRMHKWFCLKPRQVLSHNPLIFSYTPQNEQLVSHFDEAIKRTHDVKY